MEHGVQCVTMDGTLMPDMSSAVSLASPGQLPYTRVENLAQVLIIYIYVYTYAKIFTLKHVAVLLTSAL